MARSRRKANLATTPSRGSHEDEPKWLVATVASLILFVALWADHGSLAEDYVPNVRGSVSRGLGGAVRSSRTSRVSREDFGDHLPPLIRTNVSEFRMFSQQFEGQRPVLVTEAVNWPAMKDWSRKRFANSYHDEMLVLTITRGGLSRREVVVAPAKELNYYAKNASVESWALVEDDMFLTVRPKLMQGAGQAVYTQNNLFAHFPQNCRPSNLTLIWGSVFSRSVLRVANYNATTVHVLLKGRRIWKLFPPSQSEYLYLDVPDGMLSGLALQFYSYTSPVDAFMPDATKYPLFGEATSVVLEQHPGDVLIVPPGWFAQWFSVSETLGTMTPVLNEHNYDIVLSEILKVRDQVKWNELPLELEALSPEEQVKSVVGNLADAVHWRANLTRSAMLMQFGPEAHKQENQPLKFLQDAVMNNPQLLSAGAGLPGLSRQEPKPGGSQQCEANDQDLVQQLFKNADPALQGLLNVPQALLDALNEGSLTQ